MKKTILFTIAVLILASTTVCCFATDGSKANGGVPIYENGNSATSKLIISGNTANYKAVLTTNVGQSISSVKATLKLVNSKGNLIKTKTDTSKMVEGHLSIADSASLTERGTYHAEYIFKIYKSGKLVETLTGKSNSVTY